MIGGISVKVCGITSPDAAAVAAEIGADYFGFNFYPKSPRFLSWKKYTGLAKSLPDVRRAAVVVEPTSEELEALRQAGFDAFQIHFRPDLPPEAIADWSSAVGPKNLWLAPKLPAGTEINPNWLEWAGTFLLDTYEADRFGGSGRTGDWSGFARHRARYPEKTWILAGGLNAENVGSALKASGARFVDVNSGVESAPGVKDAGKLRAFAEAVRLAGG